MSKNQNYRVMNALGFLGVKPDCCLVCVENKTFSTSAVNQDSVIDNGSGSEDFFILRNYTEGSLTEDTWTSPWLCNWIFRCLPGQKKSFSGLRN